MQNKSVFVAFRCPRWWSSFDTSVFEDVKAFDSETCGRVFATAPDFQPKWSLKDLSAASRRLDVFVCVLASWSHSQTADEMLQRHAM